MLVYQGKLLKHYISLCLSIPSMGWDFLSIPGYQPSLFVCEPQEESPTPWLNRVPYNFWCATLPPVIGQRYCSPTSLIDITVLSLYYTTSYQQWRLCSVSAFIETWNQKTFSSPSQASLSSAISASLSHSKPVISSQITWLLADTVRPTSINFTLLARRSANCCHGILDFFSNNVFFSPCDYSQATTYGDTWNEVFYHWKWCFEHDEGLFCDGLVGATVLRPADRTCVLWTKSSARKIRTVAAEVQSRMRAEKHKMKKIVNLYSASSQTRL